MHTGDASRWSLCKHGFTSDSQAPSRREQTRRFAIARIVWTAMDVWTV